MCLNFFQLCSLINIASIIITAIQLCSQSTPAEYWNLESSHLSSPNYSFWLARWPLFNLNFDSFFPPSHCSLLLALHDSAVVEQKTLYTDHEVLSFDLFIPFLAVARCTRAVSLNNTVGFRASVTARWFARVLTSHTFRFCHDTNGVIVSGYRESNAHFSLFQFFSWGRFGRLCSFHLRDTVRLLICFPTRQTGICG
ncbi:hypothetical protein V8B97DRAFT_1245045 [Scleroderma yunnanense]